MAIKVITIKPLSRKREDELVALLREEIDRPENMPSPAGAPLIFEVKMATWKKWKHKNYFIVWDRFEGVNLQSRQKIAIRALNVEFPGEAMQIGIDALTYAEGRKQEYVRSLIEKFVD